MVYQRLNKWRWNNVTISTWIKFFKSTPNPALTWTLIQCSNVSWEGMVIYHLINLFGSLHIYFFFVCFFLPLSDSVLVCESLLFQCRRGGGGWCWWGLDWGRAVLAQQDRVSNFHFLKCLREHPGFYQCPLHWNGGGGGRGRTQVTWTITQLSMDKQCSHSSELGAGV